MKRKLVRILLPLVILSVAGLAQTGTAAAAPASTAVTAPSAAPANSKVGVIQLQQAIIATNEGQRDLQALDKKFEPKRTELQSLNKEIEDLTKQLQTQGDKLNDGARAQMATSIDNKKKTLQRSAQDAQEDYQSQSNAIAQKIGAKMMQLLDKYAKQNNYSMIIDASNPDSTPVVWAADYANVTKEIVDLYNKESGIAAPPPAAPAPRPSASTKPGAAPPKQ